MVHWIDLDKEIRGMNMLKFVSADNVLLFYVYVMLCYALSGGGGGGGRGGDSFRIVV